MSSVGLFPQDAVIRRVDGEAALLLGGGRALLMQLAHPLVARGVAEHSGFRTAPLARLERTLAATYTVVFGPATEAARAAAAVHAVHEGVAGPGYRANDPDLLLWVHATLIDTALCIHRRFLRPLSDADAERYYQESKEVGERFGLPRTSQPEDLAAFRSYVRRMVGDLASGLSDESRRMAEIALHPRLPLVMAPFGLAFRELTAGLLPGPLRQAFRLPWDDCREVALAAASLALRTGLPRVPAILRRFPTGALGGSPRQPAPA
jgi:uncharacterized protein (DUF2236 family)